MVKGLLGSIYCEIHGNISMGRARVTSLCSQARSNLSWKISKDDTQEGKSSAVWLGLSWNLALLGGTGDRCSMTATSRTPDLMRMMAGDGSRVTCTFFLGKAILLARLRSCFIDGQGGGLGRGNWGWAAPSLEVGSEHIDSRTVVPTLARTCLLWGCGWSSWCLVICH